MQIIEAVRNRRSTRAFKPDPVPRKVVEELLDACRWAPSSQNTQSTEMAILGGKVMEEVKVKLAEKVKGKVEPNPDLPNIEPYGPYLKRAMEARETIDCHQFPQGTENLDAKRFGYFLKGGCFYYAPNGIVLYADKALGEKAIIAAGIMAQSIALAAQDYGLGTIMLTRAVNYPDILREMLKIPESKMIMLGIAIGYPDTNDPVNSCPRKREPVKNFTTWYGF